MSWQELLFRRLTGAFAGYISSPKTLEAERILGLQRSIYYGIGRNSPEFGELVAVFEPLTTPPPAAETNPFDTGGVAHGHIPLTPGALPPADILRNSLVPVEAHQAELRQWSTAAYTNPSDYRLRGEASRPGFVTTSAIDLGATVDDRAWTWEGRIPADEYRDPPLTVRKLFIKPGDLRDYQRWLRRTAPLEEAELSPHEDLVDDVSVETPHPYESMMEALEGGTHA
jgi:hypothetical protein